MLHEIESRLSRITVLFRRMDIPVGHILMPSNYLLAHIEQRLQGLMSALHQRSTDDMYYNCKRVIQACTSRWLIIRNVADMHDGLVFLEQRLLSQERSGACHIS